MDNGFFRVACALAVLGGAAIGPMMATSAAAQTPQAASQPTSQPTRTPRSMAPVDLTGYWASAVTEDWRFRMVTPPKGDYAGVPLNPDGRKAADAWDQARDIAAGEQCRAFGAAGIMRLPVRLHVTWQDDRTLRVDIDSGNQVRLFRFGQDGPAPQSEWQGVSGADWETVAQGQGMVMPANRPNADGPALSGSLKVVTTKMKPGYLRRNGVPYSGNTVLTEFFDRTTEPNGDSWLILTSVIDDPTYLQQPFMLTTHFKREADGSKFAPRPCEVTPSVVGVE